MLPRDYTTRLEEARRCYRSGDAAHSLTLAIDCVHAARGRDFAGHTLVCEVLLRTGEHTALQQFLDAKKGEFGNDLRFHISLARLEAIQGHLEQAERRLRELLLNIEDIRLERVIRFDLVKTLDRMGRFDECLLEAALAHQESTSHFDTRSLVKALHVTTQALEHQELHLPHASQRVSNCLFVTGMPRSGTTILEQMLDCHSSLHAVGETGLAGRFSDRMAAMGGGWPCGVMNAPTGTMDELQHEYLRATRSCLNLPDKSFTVDKTLFPIQQPLFLATILPGAKVIRMVREPRDTAISIYLSNFSPSWGWTRSLDSIYQVMEAERRYFTKLLDLLGVEYLTVRLNDLIEHRQPTLARALSFIDQPWEPACLSPEKNGRIVHTLSFDQVRRSYSLEATQRWQNYSQAFSDASWERLALSDI